MTTKATIRNAVSGLLLSVALTSSSQAAIDYKGYSATACRLHGTEANDNFLDTHGSGSMLKNVAARTAGVMCPFIHEAVTNTAHGDYISNVVEAHVAMTYDSSLPYSECTLYSHALSSSQSVAVSSTHGPQGSVMWFDAHLTSSLGPASRAILCWVPAGQSLYGYYVSEQH